MHENRNYSTLSILNCQQKSTATFRRRHTHTHTNKKPNASTHHSGGPRTDQSPRSLAAPPHVHSPDHQRKQQRQTRTAHPRAAARTALARAHNPDHRLRQERAPRRRQLEQLGQAHLQLGHSARVLARIRQLPLQQGQRLQEQQANESLEHALELLLLLRGMVGEYC